MSLVAKTLLRLDRFFHLSMLGAPVPARLTYSPNQESLFLTPAEHEVSFSCNLLARSLCSSAGLEAYAELLSRLDDAIVSCKTTYVHGDMFDVNVCYNSGCVFLSDLVFGWMVDQRTEYVVLVFIIMCAAYRRVNEVKQSMSISGPSVSFIEDFCTGHNIIYSLESNGSLSLEGSHILSFLSEIPSEYRRVFQSNAPEVVLRPECVFFSPGSVDVKNIHSDYISDFSRMLNRLHYRIVAGVESDLQSQVCSMNVSFSEDGQTCTLWYIEIRPCAQRLRLGRLVLWQMIRSCVQCGYRMFVVASAVDATQNLCLKLGFTVGDKHEDGGADCSMSIDLMSNKKDPSDCGVDDLLKSLSGDRQFVELDPSKFPTSAVLNDQATAEPAVKVRRLEAEYTRMHPRPTGSNSYAMLNRMDNILNILLH